MSLTKVSYSMIQGAVVNVVDYGASTSSADNHDAFIAAAAAAIGGTVQIPAGTFVCTPMAFTTKVEFIGAGKGSTTIKRKAGSAAGNYLMQFSGTGCNESAVVDLTLDGNKANAPVDAACLFLTGDMYGFEARNVGATNAYFGGSYGDGFCVGGLGTRQDLRFINCDGYSNAHSGLTFFAGVNGCQISGGRYYFNSAQGIQIEEGNAIVNPCVNINITDADCYTNAFSGCYLGGGATISVTRVTITGGKFYTNTLNGIHFGALATNCGVNGAFVYGNVREGILIGDGSGIGATGGAQYISVVGCQISGNGTGGGIYAIDLHLNGTANGGVVGGKFCSISSNVGNGLGSTAVYGIREQNGSTDNAIVGNNFTAYVTNNMALVSTQSVGNYSDNAFFSAWTPTALAGTTFSASTGYYQKDRNKVTAFFTVTFNSAGDGAQVGINNLPIISGSYNAAGGFVTFTDLGALPTLSIPNATQIMYFYKPTGVAYINSEMNGKIFRGVLEYFI
jgi:hypothetical protein